MKNSHLSPQTVCLCSSRKVAAVYYKHIKSISTGKSYCKSGTGYAPRKISAIQPIRPQCCFTLRCMNISWFGAGIGQLLFCDMECDWNLAIVLRAWFRLIEPQLLVDRIFFGTGVHVWRESQPVHRVQTLRLILSLLSPFVTYGVSNVSSVRRATDGL